MFAPSVRAAVYSCVDSHGRKTLTDQACPGGGVGAEIGAKADREASVKSKSVKVAKSTSLAAENSQQVDESLERLIEAKHNPVCKDLRVLLMSRGRFKEGLTYIPEPMPISDMPQWQKYQIECLPQAQDVVVLELAKREGARRNQIRLAECEAKLHQYEKLKQNSKNMTELELIELGVLQGEVKRGCR